MARQCLVNRRADNCGTTEIEQGLKPDRLLRFFGTTEVVP
jgi:hypothetical protein